MLSSVADDELLKHLKCVGFLAGKVVTFYKRYWVQMATKLFILWWRCPAHIGISWAVAAGSHGSSLPPWAAYRWAEGPSLSSSPSSGTDGVPCFFSCTSLDQSTASQGLHTRSHHRVGGAGSVVRNLVVSMCCCPLSGHSFPRILMQSSILNYMGLHGFLVALTVF